VTWYCSVFLCGFYLSVLAQGPSTHWSVLSGLAAAAGVLTVGLRRWGWIWNAVSSALWFSAGLMLGTTAVARGPASVTQGEANIALDVWRTGCGQTDCSAEGALTSCEASERANCPPLGSVLSARLPVEPAVGGRVQLRAMLRERQAFYNPAPHVTWPDTRPQVRARPAAQAALRLDRELWPSRAVRDFRAAVRRQFDGSLPAPHNGIARALLLGESGAVDADLNSAIRRSGVSHVLAVSGMHVTVLAGALVVCARLVLRRSTLAASRDCGRIAAWLGVALAPLVAWICGGSPSAVRAALTSTLMFLVQALGRKPAPLPVASAAVVIYAVVVPRDAVHPGFVLSVLATASLLAATAGRAAGLRTAALESGRAWVATIPMLVMCFGEPSVVALAANVLLLPVGALLIPLALLHLVAASLGLAALFGTDVVFAGTSGAFTGVSRACAAIDPGILVPGLAPLSAAGLSAACFALLYLRGRARTCLALAAGLASGLGEWRLQRRVGRDEAILTYFDVGQGDATLIELGTGERILIDGGGDQQGTDPGKEVLLPALRSRRIDALDLVVLSHAHPDHYGGLAAVLGALPVKELWEPGQVRAEAPGSEPALLLAGAEERGTRVRTALELCNQAHVLGRAHIDVVSPCPTFDAAWEPNDNSLVLRLRFGRRAFLFAGDVEQAAEAAALRERALLRADVLKVPHHGSRTSSTEAFLEAVGARIGIVSAGRGNRFGHPHADVLERLSAKLERVLVTARHGGVELQTDGDTLELSTALHGDAPP
jgi:competence protein ComEC